MHGHVARAVGLLLALSACGSRSELASVAPDATGPEASTDAAARPDGSPVTPSCAAACDAGDVCIHEYYTHDPPPPLPDGGMCTIGTQRYGRCWEVIDQCGPLPRGCVVGPTCSCPPLGPPNWPEGCACQGDRSFDCYSIGK